MASQQKTQKFDIESDWKTLSEIGINPFFERVENCSSTELKNMNIPQKSYLKCYSLVYAMCNQKPPPDYAALLYEKHSKILENYCNRVSKQKLEKVKDKIPKFLIEWITRWEKYKWIVSGLRRIFLYIDRFHVEENKQIATLTEKGYFLYKNLVFGNFAKSVAANLIQIYQNERSQYFSNLIRDCLKVFEEIDEFCNEKFYENVFEKMFFEHSTTTFNKCAANFIEEKMDFRSFLENTEIFLEEERKRSQKTFNVKTCKQLEQIAIDIFLDRHHKNFFSKEETTLRNLFRERNLDLLAKTFSLYKLESSKKGSALILRAFGHHISDRFETFYKTNQPKWLKFFWKIDDHKIKKFQNNNETTKRTISKSEDEKRKNGMNNGNEESTLDVGADRIDFGEWIEWHQRTTNCVLEEHRESQKIIEAVFNGDVGVNAVVHRETERFLNSRERFAPALAQLLNDALAARRNYRKKTNSAVETRKVVALHRFVREKKLFEKVFLLLMAERHLNENVKSRAFEIRLLEALSAVSGINWKERFDWICLEKMEFKKLQQSCFRQNLPKKNDFSVQIWNSRLFPNLSQTEIAPFGDFREHCEKFESEYQSKHKKKNLTWRFDQGRALLQICFQDDIPNGDKERTESLDVTTIQMFVLKLLEESEEPLSFEDLVSKLKIPPRLLRFHIKFLLEKFPDDSSVLRTTSGNGKLLYGINSDFGTKKRFTMSGMIIDATKFPPFSTERFDMLGEGKEGARKSAVFADFFGGYSDFGNEEELGLREKRPWPQSSAFCERLKETTATKLDDKILKSNEIGNIKKRELTDAALLKILRGCESAKEFNLISGVRKALASTLMSTLETDFIKERLSRLVELEYVRFDERKKVYCYVP